MRSFRVFYNSKAVTNLMDPGLISTIWTQTQLKVSTKDSCKVYSINVALTSFFASCFRCVRPGVLGHTTTVLIAFLDGETFGMLLAGIIGPKMIFQYFRHFMAWRRSLFNDLVTDANLVVAHYSNIQFVQTSRSNYWLSSFSNEKVDHLTMNFS